MTPKPAPQWHRLYLRVRCGGASPPAIDVRLVAHQEHKAVTKRPQFLTHEELDTWRTLTPKPAAKCHRLYLRVCWGGFVLHVIGVRFTAQQEHKALPKHPQFLTSEELDTWRSLTQNPAPKCHLLYLHVRCGGFVPHVIGVRLVAHQEHKAVTKRPQFLTHEELDTWRTLTPKPAVNCHRLYLRVRCGGASPPAIDVRLVAHKHPKALPKHPLFLTGEE